MWYLNLFEKFNSNDLRYLLCGGLAVNIYGIPRMTADIDIIIDFDPLNVSKFEKVISEFGYKKTIQVDLSLLTDEHYRNKLLKEKNLIALSYFNDSQKGINLDVLINIPFSFNELWNNKVVRQINETNIFIASPEDIIRLKTGSKREQDRQDILKLRKYLKNDENN